jgi:predicted ArsR family transcriptional regulator
MQAVSMLFGMLFGGLIVRRAMLRRKDRRDAPATRAILEHLRAQGTANRIQLQQVLDTDPMTVLRHVDRMHGQGLIKRHGHAGSATFYTLT